MITSNDYMNSMKELIESGQSVSMILSGNSMAPFLVNQRDWIYVEPLPETIKKGDMIFFVRRDGTFIMHRVYKVDQQQYYFVGDAQPVIEGPIEYDQLFGKVTKVKRKGKWITQGDFWWNFFEKIWIRIIPFRFIILRIYGIVKRGKYENK